MLWHQSKLLFIHIPKTGGSSIEHMFLTTHNTGLGPRDLRMGQHAPLGHANLLTHNDIHTYNVFTVARNTWERIISLYLIGYRHNNWFHFTRIPTLKDKKYVTFQEFYEAIEPSMTHCEDFFFYCGIDGVIPDYVKVLDFDNLDEEFILYMRSLDVKFPQHFPHSNKNPVGSETIRDYFRNDPKFIEVIGNKYQKEIEYFDYKPLEAVVKIIHKR